ncbi:MAG: heavy-metal-associated domain-containing protein [Oscillospiraceae bacterium]|nr:heavy-metal-associated domain-containing protein [Oscillospiraceae bacterium]
MKNELKVKGIMCGNCVRKVTEALMAAGAESVAVSDDLGTVTIVHGDMAMGKIISTIEGIDNGKFKVLAAE